MLKAYYIPNVIEAGCDEAGRGPLAGSVFAAAVIWDSERVEHLPILERLNDSKQMNAAERYALREVIEQEAKAWAVAEVTPEEIDQINILNAALLAMRRALGQLYPQPEHIIVDGNKWKPYIPEGGLLEVPAQTIVKGDGKYLSIAAASVLAKTYRDDYMRLLHEQYPQYHWDTNMGYPTREHYEAIAKYGITPYHRRTFRLLKDSTTQNDTNTNNI